VVLEVRFTLAFCFRKVRGRRSLVDFPKPGEIRL
jgi:hypothetical protein